jgi:hypothetical protein
VAGRACARRRFGRSSACGHPGRTSRTPRKADSSRPRPVRHSEVAVEVAYAIATTTLASVRPAKPSFMLRQAGSRRTARTLAPSP